MKVNYKYSLLLAILATLSVTLSTGCHSKPDPIRPFQPTSFKAISPMLDPNGDVYFYLNTQQLGLSLEKMLRSAQKTINQTKFNDKVRLSHLNDTIDLSANLIATSGLNSLSGIGVSSIQLKQHLFHNKFYLHHQRDKTRPASQTIWRSLGNHPHKLRTLEMLPKETVLACFMDVDLLLLKNWLRNEIARTGALEANISLSKLKERFDAGVGLEMNKILYSLAPHMGFFLTFHTERTILWPVYNRMLKLPEPALFLVLSVKDDLLFNFIRTQLKAQHAVHKSVIKKGLELISIKSKLPIPPFIQPVIAQKDGILVIGTNQHIVKSFFANNIEGKAISGHEFLSLSNYMPTKGNGFQFISTRLSKTLKDIQMQVLKDSMQNKQDAELIENMNLFDGDFNFFGIYQSMNNGLLLNANSNTCLAKIVAIQSSLFPAALISKVILPVIKNYCTTLPE